MKTVVEDLRRRFFAYAALVGRSPEQVSFQERPSDDGAAHVEQDGADLCYVVTERGRELERRRTQDPDRLLYWLLSDVTFQMACRHEGRFRKPNEDFRRQMFGEQLRLLEVLEPAWRERRQAEINETLDKHPFEDKPTRSAVNAKRTE